MSGVQRLGAFLKSPHHAWTALLTLGVGLATANVPGMIAAAAAYALAWIFLPDSRLFRLWLAKKAQAAGDTAEGDFEREREKAYMKLSPRSRSEYDQLAIAVESIRKGAGEDESLGGRLGQLAWTYLRLLLTRETLTDFCRKEPSDRVEREIAEAAAELEDLGKRAGEAQARGDANAAVAQERLLESRRSRFAGLEQHLAHVRKAESDLDLTEAEIQRLFDAVRLIQADLVTRRDPGAIGTEIDRTTSHFHRTRDWLRDLEFDQTPANFSDEAPLGVSVRVGE